MVQQMFYCMRTFRLQKCILNTSTFVLFILQIKISELQYIALFVVSGSIKKQFCNLLCQYLPFITIFSINFARSKNIGLPHVAHIVTLSNYE